MRGKSVPIRVETVLFPSPHSAPFAFHGHFPNLHKPSRYLLASK